LPSTWTDISPDDQFGPGQVAAIAAAGGHSQTVIYVLTSPNATNYNVPPVRRGPGEVWKGEVVNGLVLRWVKVSMGIRTAYNIYADPYDSNYVYVSDLGDRTIKYTGDGGATWHVDRDLTDLATSYGEFVFDCGQPARADGEERTSPLAFSCPLQSVVFDRNHPNIRAVALFGSVVFSRDAGRHWIPLLVTNDGPLDNGPPEWPFSLFYESQPNPRTGHPSLFVALVGKSIKRVDGPLLDVTAGRIAICQICATGLFGPRPKLISLVLDAPRGTIPLKRDARGDFRGTLLLDAGKTPSITYHFDVDGKETPTFTHRIAAGERDDGMFHIRGDITGCFINKVSVWLRGVFARHP